MKYSNRKRGCVNSLIKIERYYKPGYVWNGHLSRICVTADLKRPTRSMTGRHIASSWTCFGWGLQCAGCYHPAGSLLHCHFTLTAARTGRSCGGILSVALSLGSLPPDVIRHPALRSPDFPLPPGPDGPETAATVYTARVIIIGKGRPKIKYNRDIPKSWHFPAFPGIPAISRHFI